MSFLPLKTVPPTGAAGVVPMPASAAVDAFGRLRVSDPFTVFDSQFHFDKQPLVWDEAIVAGGAAAYVANQHAVEMTTTGGGATDSIVRQTFDRHYYQPGKSQLILCTGVFGAPKTGTRKRVGFFTADNGLFLEIDGTTAKVVRRTSTSGSPVDDAVAQASWNVDPMNGTGPSGITINFDSTQIFFIDLEWLGVGSVRFGFVIGGVPYVVHRLQNANSGLTLPYMQTATLPVRYELTNTAAPGSTTTLRQICATVISEGGQSPGGIVRSQLTGVKNFASGAGIIPMVGLRLKSTAVKSKIVIVGATFAADSTDPYSVTFWRNPTLTTPTWTSVGTDSIAETTINGVVAITGGTRLRTFLVGTRADLQVPVDELLPGGASIGGTPIEIVLTANKLKGGGADSWASLNWKELQ